MGNRNKLMTIEERFWSKVDVRGPDDCWEWKRSLNETGYGNFRRKAGSTKAHRIAWELANQAEVPKDLHVHHTCGNRACVNPSHLELKSPKEHSAEVGGDHHWSRKYPERVTRGMAHWQQKLTDDDVRWIRWVYADKRYTQEQLGRHIGVSAPMISCIVSRKCWSHVR